MPPKPPLFTQTCRRRCPTSALRARVRGMRARGGVQILLLKTQSCNSIIFRGITSVIRLTNIYKPKVVTTTAQVTDDSIMIHDTLIQCDGLRFG